LPFHQGAVKGIYSSPHEVSLVLPRDSLERKLKRKSYNMVPESHTIEVVEKNNELHIHKKFKSEVGVTAIEKFDAHYEHLVFAILAPSKIKSNQRLEVLPIKNTSPISSMSKAKIFQQKEKGGLCKVSSSSLFLDYSKEDTTKDEGTNIENVERKNEDMLGEGTPNKNMKLVQSSNCLVEKKKPPKLQKKTTKGAVISTIQSSKLDSSIPILQTRKVLPAKKVLKAKILNSNVMKMDLSTIPHTSLCTSKEVLQTNDINMILKRIEDFPRANSTNESQFGSQTQDIFNKKGNISIAKDLCCYGSNSLESPRITFSKNMTNIGQVVNLLESLPSTCVGQVISSHLIIISKLFV